MGQGLRSGSRLFGLRLLSYAILFVVSLIVSRSLGPGGRARYALPQNLATIVWLLAGLSLDFSTGAMFARGEASLAAICRFLSAATLTLGTVGLLVVCGIGTALSHELLAGASLTLIFLAALSVPLNMAVQMSSAILVRVGALRAFGWALVAGAVAQLAFVLFIRIAIGHLTPQAALAGVALGWLVTALPLIIVVRQRVGPGALVPSPPRGVARPAVLAGLALQPAALALYLNLGVDLLIVGALASARQAGFYSLSAALSSIIFLAASQLCLSAMKAQTDAPLEEANRYTLAFIRQSVILTLGAAVVVAAASWPLLRVFFGHVWTPSVAPLVILTFAAVTFAAEGPARIMLMRMRRTRLITLAAITGTVVNVACNLALIPLLGIVGAALASLLSYSLYTIMLLVFFVRSAGLPGGSWRTSAPAGEGALDLLRGAGRLVAARGRVRPSRRPPG